MLLMLRFGKQALNIFTYDIKLDIYSISFFPDFRILTPKLKNWV